MIKLSEALTAEREKRLRAEANNSTRQQIGQAVLEALAQRLNADPIFGKCSSSMPKQLGQRSLTMAQTWVRVLKSWSSLPVSDDPIPF